LLFAAGGVFIAMETAVPTFQDWQTMQSWQTHSAKLISVTDGSGSAEASYRYDWKGVTFQNDRVYVARFKDNIGSYQDQMYGRLDYLHRNNQPVTIFLDPANPQQSVIDRNMRWGLFTLAAGFCSIFFLVGVVVIYASVSAPKKNYFEPPTTTQLRREHDLKKQHKDFNQSFMEYRAYRLHELKQQADESEEQHTQPGAWQERDGWQKNGIRSEARRGTLYMWGFAIFWNAVSSPLLFQFIPELEDGNYAILLGLLFPVVGVYLLYKAILMTLEYRRYGVILLNMDPFPGSIGGHIGGSLEVKGRDNLQSDFRIGVECVYSYVSGSGDNRSRSERIRWSEQGSARIDNHLDGVRLSFRFDVPEGLPEADVDQKGDYYFWRLRLKAEVEGVDLDRNYNIPVMGGGELSTSIDHDLSAQVLEEQKQQAEVDQSAIERGDFVETGLLDTMRIYDHPHEFRLYQPMFRNKFLTLFLAAIAGGFNFAFWSVYSESSAESVIGVVAMIFMIPFGLIGLLAAIATVYMLFNNLTLRITRNHVYVRRSLLVIPVLIKKLKSHEITSMNTKKTGSTGQGNNKIVHYKIEANYSQGSSITVAEDIDGEDLANSFKDFLLKRIKYIY